MSRLKKKLKFEKTNLLLTRPKEDSENLSRKLDSKKFNFFISPMLEINQVDYKLDSIKDYDFVLFTSKNGLRYFKGLKKNSKIIVIGDGTYLKAKEMGIKKVINIDGNLEDLKKQIILELKKDNKILHPKSNILDENLFKYFRDFGCYYEPLVCYTSDKKNTKPEIFEKFFLSCKDGIITLFSKRTAMSFVNEISKNNLLDKCNERKILVLSNEIKNALEIHQIHNIFVTKKPNEQSMIKLIQEISDGGKFN